MHTYSNRTYIGLSLPKHNTKPGGQKTSQNQIAGYLIPVGRKQESPSHRCEVVVVFSGMHSIYITYIYILVGGFNPSEKLWSSTVGIMKFPTEWKF